MPGRLNDQLLTDFAHRFFGYGNLDALVWFIGMEEGGGSDASEIVARLESWDAHGRAPVVDIVSFGQHAGLDEHLQWFDGERPPLQSTWRQLIRVQLGRLNAPIDADSVRHYQRDRFSREDGDECLLELLPFPSPSVGEWRYPDWSSLLWLSTREQYREHLLDVRSAALTDLICEHEPNAVVFYSKSYAAEWKRIAGLDDWTEETIEGVGIEWGRSAGTRWVIIPHPASYGVTNRFFESLGAKLRT